MMTKNPMTAWRRATLVLPALACAGAAWAQATVKEDGVWRAALGAAYTSTAGNTRSTTMSGFADAVRATANDKTNLYASALYGKSQGLKTADQWRLGGKQDWNLTARMYVFALAEMERDDIAGLQYRATGAGGVGWRFVNTESLKFEVFGGGAYVADRYEAPRVIDGESRRSYNHPTLLLGEESLHKLGESTTAKQRLVLYPDLRNRGEYRALWDGTMAVPVSSRLSLTAGFNLRYNSEPGAGLKKADTLFTTGVSLKFD